MSEAIVCKLSPIKTLTITRSPLRELLNFLVYRQHPELLNERARRQPIPALEKIPATVRELKNVLKAEKCDKNEKLFIDCENRDHTAILLHNEGVQFWIHYFSCGIGLVNLSYFSHLATAEVSLSGNTRNVKHSYEYQWFTHDLKLKFFECKSSEADISKLGDYFIERINPTLVCPYAIYFEKRGIKEPYKFISGSFEQLRQILKWTYFVCDGLKRERGSGVDVWISSYITINCGNLRSEPTVEFSTEPFINAVCALAIRENAPYTVLCQGFGRHDGGDNYDWMRKNKHRIYVNLRAEIKDTPPRERIAARFHLVKWLKDQGEAGERVIKTWKLEFRKSIPVSSGLF